MKARLQGTVIFCSFVIGVFIQNLGIFGGQAALAQEAPREINKNIVVLLDLSGNVKTYTDLNNRAADYIRQMLWENITKDNILKDDALKANHFEFSSTNWSYPLLELDNGDLLTLYGFGTDRRFVGTGGQDYVEQFSKSFLLKKRIRAANTFDDSLKAIRQLKYRYDLFDYVYPLALRDVYKEGYYQNKLLFIVFSDFNPGVNDQFITVVPEPERKAFYDLNDLFKNYFDVKERLDLRIRRVGFSRVDSLTSADSTTSVASIRREQKVLPLKAFEIAPPGNIAINWEPAYDVVVERHLQSKTLSISPVGFRISGLHEGFKLDGIDLDVFSSVGERIWSRVHIQYDSLANKGGGDYVYEIQPFVLSEPDINVNFSAIALKLHARFTYHLPALSDEIGFRFWIDSPQSPAIAVLVPGETKLRWILYTIMVALFIYMAFLRTYGVEVKFIPGNNLTLVWTLNIKYDIKAQIEYKKFFFARWKPINVYISDHNEDVLKIDGLPVPTKSDPQKIFKNSDHCLKLTLAVDEHRLKGEEEQSGGFVLHVNVNGKRSKKYPFTYKVVNPCIDAKIDPAFFDFKDPDVDLGDDVPILIEREGTQYTVPLQVTIANFPKDINYAGKLNIVARIAPESQAFYFQRTKTHEVTIHLAKRSEKTDSLPERNELTDSHPEPIIIDTSVERRVRLKMPETKDDIQTIKLTLTLEDIKTVDPLEKTVKFAIKPNLGSYWLSVDPGTTGSSICGYDGRDKQPTMGTFGKTDEEIMPSLCYFPEDRDPIVGFDAVPFIGHTGRIFRSVKKLIGYKISKKLTKNEREIEVTGEDAAQQIIKYLMEQYIEKKCANEPERQINKIILAVPNIFTQNKIEAFKKCIPRTLRVKGKNYTIMLVKHIYEAEAIAIYLLKTRPHEVIGKTIMICDFGGGTINVSVVRLMPADSGKKESYIVDILARVGCAIGGETVTQCLAEHIWGHVKTHLWPEAKDEELKIIDESFDPFRDRSSQGSDEAFRAKSGLKDWLYKLADSTKINLNEGRPLQNIETLYLSEKAYDFKFQDINQDGKLSHTQEVNLLDDDGPTRSIPLDSKSLLRDILHGRDVSKKYFDIVEEIIKDALVMVSGGLSIDSVILAGRSSQLSGLHEKVQSTLKIDSGNFIKLDATESKTCVCKGAAYYAASRTGVYKLSRARAMASYVVRIRRENKENYIPLIEAGEPFDRSGIIPKKKSIEFGADNILLFLQIMGAVGNDPPPYKRSEIYEVGLDNFTHSDKAEVQITLDQKDSIQGLISNGYVSDTFKKDYYIKDIFDDTDQSSIWHIT